MRRRWAAFLVVVLAVLGGANLLFLRPETPAPEPASSPAVSPVAPVVSRGALVAAMRRREAAAVGTAVVVVVCDRGDRPVAGVEVLLVGYEAGKAPGANLRDDDWEELPRSTTNAAGEASFGRLPPEGDDLWVIARRGPRRGASMLGGLDGSLPLTCKVILTAPEERLAPGRGAFSGLARSKGKPLLRTKLHLRWHTGNPKPDAAWSPLATVWTDGDGAFLVPDLPPGRFTAELTTADLPAATVVVDIPAGAVARRDVRFN